MEQELNILYLTTLQREPSVLERSSYLNDLISGIVKIDNIRIEIENSIEYKQLQTGYAGDLTYDRSTYIMELTNLNENNYDGITISNGKICVKTSPKPYETNLSAITTNFEFNNLGRYNNNITHGFTFTNVKFFNYDYADVSITNMKQSLNMYNATFKTEYTLSYSGTSLTITQEWMALQQYPYCFLHTISIDNPSGSTIDLNVFHMLSCGDNLENVEYFNNTLNGLMTFSAKGTDSEKSLLMATNNTYVRNGNDIKNVGFTKVDDKTGYNKLIVKLIPGSITEFSIVSGLMSTSDFPDPQKELIRILHNIKDKHLRVEHNQKWINIWRTADIVISQKNSIEPEELDIANQETELFQKHLKYSLYNIFSIVRDDVNVDLNTLNLSAVDLDGEIFWNAEMFLIPVLLMLRPKCAKVLLDFRFKQLQHARNLALAYGHKGSLYPYKEDIANYTDVYWTSGTPVYAFNTGLIAISAWNYYRVSLDKYWLHEKGFPIIQNCARFFQSLFDFEYNLVPVYTMNNTVEANNALTRYLAIHILKNYREACYELSFSIPHDMDELYHNVKTNVVDVSSHTEDASVSLPQNVFFKSVKDELTLYNTDTMELIGTRYGGYSGNYLKVEATVDYTFTIERNTFVKLYDLVNTEITVFEGTALYSSQYGFTDGTVLIENGNVSSYSNIYMKDYVFGKNAFVKTTGNKQFHNVINTDPSNAVLESHFILMTYYSNLFFNTQNSVNKTDIIQDNLLYYNLSNTNSDSFFNKFIKSNLEGLLAQDVGLSTAKEFYVNKFESTMKDIFVSEEMKKPWGNHNYHAFLIFNILTSVVKMRIKGNISDQRFYVDNFGIDSKSGYVLPKYWNRISVVYDGKPLTIINKY
jgi:trehalose/maltose hydrolase-like predicted phosphorylase